MSDDLAPIRRGLVLRALLPQYPLPLVQLMLDRQVAIFYADDPRAQTRDLAYLAEKGLLKVAEEKVGGRPLRTYVLTAAGVDVASGSVDVPGVEIDEP